MSTVPDFTSMREELKRFAGLIQAYLTTFYDRKVIEAESADHVFGDTMRVVSDFMLRRGKCVQSFVSWCAYKMAGGTNDEAMIRVGGAIEANHYFLLSIDDMADRDTLRHGGPTIEIMFRKLYTQIPADQRDHYARSFSEIASSLIYSHVFEMLQEAGMPADKTLAVMRIVTDKILHAPATGWQIHMLQNFDPLSKTQEERFIKGLKYVTADYKFVGPSLIGLTLADGSDALKNALIAYGEHVGTAFQVYDDILGLFGDPKVTGKAAGNDVREGKKTLLLQRAYARADETDKRFLNKTVGKPLNDEQVEKVREIVRKTNSLDHSREIARSMVDKGKAALAPLKDATTGPYIGYLEDLAEFMIARDK